MPSDDVSDLRDVVDAINKLCDTMKTSYETDYEDISDVQQEETFELVKPVEAADTWSEPQVDIETAEMYYSAYAEGEEVAKTLDNWIDAIVKGDEAEENARVDYRSESITEGDDIGEISQVNYRIDSIVEKDEVGETSQGDDWSDQLFKKVQVTEKVKKEEIAQISDIDKWSEPVLESETTALEHGPARSERSCETYYMASSELERKTETQHTERWSDTDTAAAPYEPSSEMYYTASSEVSLLSETDLMDKAQNEDSDKDKGDRNIMAGHVAAMRERFESMTRANTPCPDLVRSLSPSLDVFRNITPSPDFLDKS